MPRAIQFSRLNAEQANITPIASKQYSHHQIDLLGLVTVSVDRERPQFAKLC